MPNGIDFSVDDPDQQESQMPVYDPYQIEAQSGGPETPREFLGPPALQKPILGIYGVPEDIHGTPGIGVVGPQRFRVGIQAPQTLAQYEALRASQGPRTVQEANLIANQAAQEANFQRQLMQSAKVEDAAKAIAASRRYIAMRKLARDWQTGKAAGLSDEQSWVHAAVNNLEAFGGNLAPVTAAMREARTVQPFTPSNVAIPITTSTGEIIAYGAQSTPTGRHILPVRPDVKSELTPAQRANALAHTASIIQRELAEAGMDPDFKTRKDYYAKRREDLANIESQLRDLGGLPTEKAPVPAPAVPAPEQSKREKGKFYSTPKGIAKWTGEAWQLQ